ncbi:MAG: DUF58 domain-containing protein [Planctomycetota bacterium]
MSRGRGRLDLPTPCSSGAMIFAVGNLSLLSGLALGNGGAVALGAVLLTLPLIVYLRLRRAAERVHLAQEAPEAAYEGDVVVVRITLQNAGTAALVQPRFSEIFSPEDHAQKSVVFADRVEAGESATAEYRGLCLGPRGIHRFGPSAVRISDPFGWFEIHGGLESDRHITVYPRLDDFGIIDALAASAPAPGGEMLRSGPGDSQEFWSVREYRRGDSRRRIHWSATARRGDLVVREFGRPASGDTSILLDLDGRFTGAQLRFGAFENAIRLAASLVQFSLAQGRRIPIVDEQGRRGPAPGAPGANLVDWLDELVRVQTGSIRPFDAVIEAARPLIATSAVVIAFVHSYLYEDEAVVHALGRLAGDGRRVVAVLFDDDDEGDDARRRLVSHRLSRRGVEVQRLRRMRRATRALEFAS